MAQTEEAIYSHGTQNFIDHTATGAAVAFGEVVMQPASAPWLAGVANQAIAEDALGALDVGPGSVYKLKKTATHTFNAGDEVDWDVSAGAAVTDGHASSDGQIGTAVAAAASGDDYVLTAINITPQPS